MMSTDASMSTSTCIAVIALYTLYNVKCFVCKRSSQGNAAKPPFASLEACPTARIKPSGSLKDAKHIRTDAEGCSSQTCCSYHRRDS